MIAVLFAYIPSTRETMTQVVDYGENPMVAADEFRRAFRDDFPDAIWSIAGDAEAKTAAANARMKQLLGDDWEPEA